MDGTAASDGGEALAALLHEHRRFEPPAGMAARANARTRGSTRRPLPTRWRGGRSRPST